MTGRHEAGWGRWTRSSVGRRPSFGSLLQSALDQDDGLLLRVTALERMERTRGKPIGSGGRTASIFGSLIRRSRKIFDAQARSARAR